MEGGGGKFLPHVCNRLFQTAAPRRQRGREKPKIPDFSLKPENSLAGRSNFLGQPSKNPPSAAAGPEVIAEGKYSQLLGLFGTLRFVCARQRGGEVKKKKIIKRKTPKIKGTESWEGGEFGGFFLPSASEKIKLLRLKIKRWLKVPPPSGISHPFQPSPCSLPPSLPLSLPLPLPLRVCV